MNKDIKPISSETRDFVYNIPEKYKDDLKTQELRYHANSLSYWLGFLGLICNVVYLFMALNSVKPDIWISLKIMFNIIMILMVFLSVEKVKAYSSKFCYVLFLFGGLCLARIFWIPIRVIKRDNINTIFLQNCVDNPEAALRRGLFLIILLAASAILLISSAIIGLIKSKRLNDYLACLGEKK